MKNLKYIHMLRDRQIHEGWSDRRMAGELDISHQTWLRVANGTQNPSFRFLQQAMKRFPEYDLDLLFSMRTDDQEDRQNVPTTHPAQADHAAG